MKKDLRKWIDKEVSRLEREDDGGKPEGSVKDPVPDELREALREKADKKNLAK